MAGVLETLTVPRSLPATLAPNRTSSVSVIAGGRRSVSLPESRGLKIHSLSTSISNRSTGSGIRRGGGIVCEAQNTAVEVPALAKDMWKSLVLESTLPVLVEFWAPWCGPCRMIHSVIDELSKDYAGKLKCYRLNTDECPDIATDYGIRSIPTVIIFKGGEKKDAIIGAVPKTTLTTCIEKFL